MPLSVQIGLLLALATAFASIVGFLYKHRGAAAAPPVQWRHPVRSTTALFANRWWTIGMLVATSSWLLHVAALSLAPISLVQSVIAGSLVLLTVIADRLFGLTVTRRQWIGVALTAVGLTILATTLGDSGASKHSDYTTTALVLWVGGLGALSLPALVLAGRTSPSWGGPLLAAAAGLQWGASDVTIKAASGHFDEGGLVLLPMVAAITMLSLVGLMVSARSLQVGDAVPVIAVTSVAANLATIASGLVVFGEPLPSGSGAIALRLAAFVLVVMAAILTPGPLRVGAASQPDPA